MAREKIFVDPSVIVDTAFDMINSLGISAFSTRKLANELDISPMTLYNYMQNKDDIIAEVYIRGLKILKQRVEEIAADSLDLKHDPLSIYKVLADVAYDFASENKNVYFMIFNMKACEFQNVDEVRKLYSSAFIMIKDFIPKEKLEEVHEEIFMFEILMNGLINQQLVRGDVMNRTKYDRYIAAAMEKLFTVL